MTQAPTNAVVALSYSKVVITQLVVAPEVMTLASTYQCCLGVNIVQRNGFQSYCCGTRTYDSSIDRVALVMLYVGVPASGGFAYQWEHRISVGSCMGLILSLYYMVIHLVSM